MVGEDGVVDNSWILIEQVANGDENEHFVGVDGRGGALDVLIWLVTITVVVLRRRVVLVRHI